MTLLLQKKETLITLIFFFLLFLVTGGTTFDGTYTRRVISFFRLLYNLINACIALGDVMIM
jgi:hypothetical protein